MGKYKFLLDIQFFGRGRSKSGGGTGGGSGGGATLIGGGGSAGGGAVAAAGDVDDQADTTQQAPAQSSVYQDFATMTDQQKADAVKNALKSSVPDHLNNNSDFQKLTYNLNMNDKPQLVDDATLNSMNGTECFRTVDSVYNRQADISFTAPQIAAQTMAGRYTRCSSDGQACYGDGIYFAKSRSASTPYGSTRGDVNKTCVMRAKLNSNAKVISYSSATNGMYREMRSGSEFGKQLRRCKSESAVSIYALANGYNVIDNGMGYLNVLNRGALTMSKSLTAK